MKYKKINNDRINHNIFKNIYSNLLHYEIVDDVAAYALYSNQNNVNSDIITSLLNGYDFIKDTWINKSERQKCINHIKNFYQKSSGGRSGHNNIVVLRELKQCYPDDF